MEEQRGCVHLLYLSGKLYREILTGQFVGFFNTLEVLHSPNASSLEVRHFAQ